MPKTTQLKKHPLYNTWCKMKSRCYNPRNIRYAQYGGRGIAVCERWRSSFLLFLNDIGPRPSDKHSLDRIDNSGNYEPSNCRWALPDEQTLNQGLRVDNKTGHKNIYWCNRFKKFAVKIGGHGKIVTVGSFKSLEEAVRAKEDYIKTHGIEYTYHKCVGTP